MSDIETQKQAPKKHAGGRPRKDALDAASLQEVFEASLKRGLVSTNATVQAQSLKNAGDLLNPALGELRAEISELKKKLATAEEALPVVTRERDQAQGLMVIAIQSALQKTSAKAELAELKSNFDGRASEMRKELLDGATQKLWSAQRSENSARETLQNAERQFGQAGLQLLLDEVKKIVEQFSVPEPALESLPAGISSLYLTAWGHSPTRASYMLAYAKAFPEPSDNFKQTVLRFMSRPDSTPDFNVRREVLIAMAVKWSVFNELQRITDAKDLQRRADFLRNSNAILQRTEMELTRKGYGRTEIGHEEQSPTGYTGECIDPEHCACPKHNGLPQHLRVDTWLGTRQTAAKEDINDRHVDTEMLDYGAQLIARENAAKAGKILAVDVPESMRRSPIPLDDNEELS
jgi:hypothetical protein